jgi:hypothetical protein
MYRSTMLRTLYVSSLDVIEPPPSHVLLFHGGGVVPMDAPRTILLGMGILSLAPCYFYL